MIYLPVLKISSQYNMCVSSLYHYLHIYYCIKMQKFHNFTLNSGLCPQCGVIVDSSVRYSESQHQSLCNGLQQANKPELSSVASFFFTHLGLGYSLLWCRFTHYFKLHRQSGGGRVCRGLRRGISAPWKPHADWLSPTKCLIKPQIKEFLNHGTNWTSILKSENWDKR